MTSPANPPPAARDQQWEWHTPGTVTPEPPPAPASEPPHEPPFEHSAMRADGSGSRGGLIVIAIVAALAVAVAGLVAAFGGSESGSAEGPAVEGCEGIGCGPEANATPGPRTLEIPEGHLGVASLGALTPDPGPPWTPYVGPGADELLAEDAHALEMRHTQTWISYLMVGRLGEFGLIAEPENLPETAVEIVDTWVFDYPYSGTTGLERSEPALTETRVDGHPAVLLETRVTWDTLDSSPDMYEDLALLLVDPGENGIFLGVAAVPESGTAQYEAAVEALMQTTFRHNTYLP